MVLGAMVGYATSYLTGSPWLGVLAAALAGACCWAGCTARSARCAGSNDVAMGIAIMLAGTGLAFFFGKPFIQPSAPLLPSLPLGFWSSSPQLRSALSVSPLFLLGPRHGRRAALDVPRHAHRAAHPYRR